MMFHELVVRRGPSPEEKGRAPLLINILLEEDFNCLRKEGCSQLYLSSYSAVGNVVRPVQVSSVFVEVCHVEIFKIINSSDGQFLQFSFMSLKKFHQVTCLMLNVLSLSTFIERETQPMEILYKI